jgi:hypothetical protein
MAKDIKVFVQNCLHCVSNFPREKLPRILATQFHATKPSEKLHSDFPYIALSRYGKNQYIQFSRMT